MRFGKVSATLAVSCVLLAGCGSSSSSNSGSASGGSSTPAASSSSGSPVSSNFSSAQNCAQLAGVGQQFEKAIEAVTGKSPNLSGVASAYQNLANASPSAIKPDMETIASELTAFVTAVQKVGYKSGQTPSASQIAGLQSAVKTLDQNKLRTAEQAISSWAATNCKS